MSELPRRKNIRLKDYDYSQSGYYFVTICTHERLNLLSNIVGGGFHAAPQIELTEIGKEIVKSVEYLDNHIPNVGINNYVVMPNHVHLIITLDQLQEGGHGSPPLHKIVGQFKSYTNKIYNELNKAKNLILWQRNYYDHIIRNDREYHEIYEYIENNPIKWELDEYYK